MAYIVVNAPEGLCLSITEKYGYKFSRVKSAYDIVSVLVASGLSILFLGQPGNIREAAVIAALAIGRLVGLLMKNYESKLEVYLF